MRIAYAIHGYGRGHATRALALLPHLARQHQLLILAGGDAHAAIWADYPVVRIPTLGFAYGPKSGTRSNFHTFRRNLPAAMDLFLGGPVFDMVTGVLRDFAPDVVISDAEAWSHRAARHLRIPRIGLDHIGILAYCKPNIEWRDRLEGLIDTNVYRLLMGRPDRVIVSSFYDAPPRRPGVRVVGTLPRQEIRHLTPVRGDHLLAYFNRGEEQLQPPLVQALQDVGCPVHVYGTARQGRDGRLTYLPPSNLPFLEDLAACRAVVSTAGNQLMGEAIYLGKPVLVMPERCVEQRLNAAAVERLGIGARVTARRFTAERLQAFLAKQDEYVAAMKQHVRDGEQETLAALEQYLAELAPAAYAATRADTVPTPATAS